MYVKERPKKIPKKRESVCGCVCVRLHTCVWGYARMCTCAFVSFFLSLQPPCLPHSFENPIFLCPPVPGRGTQVYTVSLFPPFPQLLSSLPSLLFLCLSRILSLSLSLSLLPSLSIVCLFPSFAPFFLLLFLPLSPPPSLPTSLSLSLSPSLPLSHPPSLSSFLPPFFPLPPSSSLFFSFSLFLSADHRVGRI